MSEGNKTLDGRQVQLSNDCRKCILSRVKSIEFNMNKSIDVNVIKT